MIYLIHISDQGYSAYGVNVDILLILYVCAKWDNFLIRFKLLKRLRILQKICLFFEMSMYCIGYKFLLRICADKPSHLSIIQSS